MWFHRAAILGLVGHCLTQCPIPSLICSPDAYCVQDSVLGARDTVRTMHTKFCS